MILVAKAIRVLMKNHQPNQTRVKTKTLLKNRENQKKKVRTAVQDPDVIRTCKAQHKNTAAAAVFLFLFHGHCCTRNFAK